MSRRERRMIAIGLLVAALGLGWLLMVRPLLAGFSARAEERLMIANDIARSQRIIDSEGFWRRQSRSQREDAERYALAAPDAEFAAEAARDRVVRAFAGATIRGIRSIAAPPGFVRLRADVSLDNAQLVAALRRLQTGQPIAPVTSLTVVADEAFVTGRLGQMDAAVEISFPYPDAAAR